jgi:hypothetical protein
MTVEVDESGADDQPLSLKHRATTGWNLPFQMSHSAI